MRYVPLSETDSVGGVFLGDAGVVREETTGETGGGFMSVLNIGNGSVSSCGGGGGGGGAGLDKSLFTRITPRFNCNTKKVGRSGYSTVGWETEKDS